MINMTLLLRYYYSCSRLNPQPPKSLTRKYWETRRAELSLVWLRSRSDLGFMSARSPRAEEDFEQLNPFLDRAKAAGSWG